LIALVDAPNAFVAYCVSCLSLTSKGSLVTDKRRASGASRDSNLQQSLQHLLDSVRLTHPATDIKRLYWTEAKLLRLFRDLIKPDRRQWFAARVHQLQSWPEVDKEKMLEAAARIQPKRLMGGSWAWPKRELEIQRDLLRSAPENGIDLDGLRASLAMMDDRAGDRLIEMIAESGFLKDTTAPLDSGLPQPQEIGLPLLRRIKRLHSKLLGKIAGDPDGDLVRRRCEVPRANLQSSSGRLEARAMFRLRNVWRGE
jgi:hypothetical protein